MRNSPLMIAEQFIRTATISFLKKKDVSDDTPLEYFADEILLLTLGNCCSYFLSLKNLRTSEKNCLTILEQDISDKIDLSLIEQRLEENLSKIKPVWGELFGTNRGLIYNTFISIKKWSCFRWHARLYYSEQKQKKQGEEARQLCSVISKQSEHLAQASQLILQHEAAASSLTQRATEQFTAIQKLRVEKAELESAVATRQTTTRSEQSQRAHHPTVRHEYHQTTIQLSSRF